MNCSADQLNGFYMMGTLVVKRLSVSFLSCRNNSFELRIFLHAFNLEGLIFGVKVKDICGYILFCFWCFIVFEAYPCHKFHRKFNV